MAEGLRWVRHKKWKVIRSLIDSSGQHFASIKRMGNNRYTVNFVAYPPQPDYPIEGELKVAKAVGLMIVRMQS